MKLAKNFSLKEMTASQTAERMNITNEPGQEELVNLVYLCANVLQPVREHYEKVVTVSSGFRCKELNTAIGSNSETSQHVTGQASDFELYGIDNLLVAKFIQSELEFDNLILEFYSPPNGGWIHCSYNAFGENRKKCLTASRDENGKVQYKEGLNG